MIWKQWLCQLIHAIGFVSSSPISSLQGVYDSSFTPSHLPWNTYNYCNAAHVNLAHYFAPEEAQLVYMNTVIRHHKRTPDNLYPEENSLNAIPWNCTGFEQFNYGGGSTHIFHQIDTPPWHPFLSQIWNGTCDEGQLTEEGLQDAIRHGKDFWNVYSNKLKFLSSVNERDIFIRTSPEARTFQVAGGLLTGMDSKFMTKSFPVVQQPAPIDSIEPSYSCPKADSVRDAYQSVPAWTDHLQTHADFKNGLDAILGTAGLADWASWYDHFFDTFTSRTCHGHPLPCNMTTGACVSEDDAATVFSIGDFEYNYIWNTAVNSTVYNQLTFGVFMLEIANNFKLFRVGRETRKLRFYVGHDGSMIRLAALLGLGKIAPLRWPALGSEIVMEVWRTAQKQDFVRVIHEGTPVPTMERIPLDTFITVLDAAVPQDIFWSCQS